LIVGDRNSHNPRIFRWQPNGKGCQTVDNNECPSQSSHRKGVKPIQNQGFLTTPKAMGLNVPVKTPTAFRIINEINGFVHNSYGTALNVLLDQNKQKIWLY